jgi:transcription elongation GreA/GreB family factor
MENERPVMKQNIPWQLQIMDDSENSESRQKKITGAKGCLQCAS